MDRTSVSCTEGVAQTPRGRVKNTNRKSSFFEWWLPRVKVAGWGEDTRMAKATVQKEVKPPELGRRFRRMFIGVSMPRSVGE